MLMSSISIVLLLIATVICTFPFHLQQLSSGQAVVEKGDGFPESDSSQTSKLRQTLLTQHNELLQMENRTIKLDREIEQWGSNDIVHTESESERETFKYTHSNWV